MNKNEAKVKQWLNEKNWEIINKGWPDFLCYNKENRQVMTVEVKTNGDKIRPEQNIVHTILRIAGIPVHVVKSEKLQKYEELKSTTFVAPESIVDIRNEIEYLKMRLQTLLEKLGDNNELEMGNLGIRNGFIINFNEIAENYKKVSGFGRSG